jgi:hypothetical protein
LLYLYSRSVISVELSQVRIITSHIISVAETFAQATATAPA